MSVTFNLPDLGEGLPEAEIVSWHVTEGQRVEVDQPLLSVETAKAVVDVPSPYSGSIVRLHAKAGDTVQTGKPLVDFALPSQAANGTAATSSHDRAAGSANSASERGATFSSSASPYERAGVPASSASAHDRAAASTTRASAHYRTSPGHGAVKGLAGPAAATQANSAGRGAASGQGMVVGHMATRNEDFVDHAIVGRKRRSSSEGDRVRAPPAVRMLAKRLGVELASCQATGRHGLVSIDDVLARSNFGRSSQRAPAVPGLTDADKLRGARKAMAQSMSLSRDETAMCTIFDDADIDVWKDRGDITIRLVRAIVAGIKAEPALNALFDPAGPSRKLLERVDLAIAVDTSDGLIVPVLRDVSSQSAAQLRVQLDDIKQRTRARTITPEEMRNYTFTLSNFGTVAGRYATPLVVPPTVAILGAGRLQRDVVAGAKAPEIHVRLPLSLTFDHRCVTGGEALRFLAAAIANLQLPS